MLGTYLGTETPGQFRYQPGVLVEAVVQGRWILIEDIDLAPLDVVSLLIPLLESRRLFVPGRGEEYTAAPGFQLFATRRWHTDRGSNRVSNAALLENLWTRVLVTPPTHGELAVIVGQVFPTLAPLLERVMATYALLQDPPVRQARLVSPRDLIKWCARLARAPELSLLVVLQEALDCFTGAFAQAEARHQLAAAMARLLDVPPEALDRLLHQHQPLVQELGPAAVQVGRVTLQRDPAVAVGADPAAPGSASVYAQTRHSKCLMEQLAASVLMNEPVLLVGETGTGKTTAVQHLAQLLHRQVVAINMSQQSDSSDLIGGFKPVNLRALFRPAVDQFELLFFRTFSRKKNAAFVDRVRSLFVAAKYQHVVAAFESTLHKVEQRQAQQPPQPPQDAEEHQDTLDQRPTVRKPATQGDEGRSCKRSAAEQLNALWDDFAATTSKLRAQLGGKLAFAFVEGALLRAATHGDWVLLDELNLATSETLECLNGILECGKTGHSIVLTERGDTQPIHIHPGFRVFACMNPATDVGKRDLPPGIRNRFTEFYVDEMADPNDLALLVHTYLLRLGGGGGLPGNINHRVVQFYQRAKEQAALRALRDGTGQSPHYSLRTLCRGLMHAERMVRQCSPLQALWEGLCMSFQTQLDVRSYGAITGLCRQALLDGKKFIPGKPCQVPDCVQVLDLWLAAGPLEPAVPAHYIMTASVQENLRNVARVVASGRFPVLLQGPTSAGKTSIIEYLAACTGHRFVRINNHEHTDIQEYIGSYVSNEAGELVFHEGALVEAVRNGYWLVLDELNLAPTEVLEALNRLLDDNRELFIHETQELVRPHPNFMLFATQNPPGLYGGRKTLSRAFRNRFVELHFDDIPVAELVVILHQRCQIPEKFCRRFIDVMKDLQKHRQGTRLFAGKHGFITLRDLFRWAERYKFAMGQTEGPVDHEQLLAEDGYILLAERVRAEAEKALVIQVLQAHFHCRLDPAKLFDCSALPLFAELQAHLAAAQHDPHHPFYPFRNVVWTSAMRRLFVIMHRALRVKDPILLVGETGCGKTTICQIFALLLSLDLRILNCHEHTETSDFIGGLRPVRSGYADADEPDEAMDTTPDNDDTTTTNTALPQRAPRRLFEWCDGPLVEAMRQGSLFLIDEISLADDSVLERINSVLEPARLLVLAEKGGEALDEIVAADPFRLMATMNPGGDFGKKELSPALRNRFTEVWVPPVTDPLDLLQILQSLLSPELRAYAPPVLAFMQWLLDQRHVAVVSLRDYAAWCTFMNQTHGQLGGATPACVHAACLTVVDGLGSVSARHQCLAYLYSLLAPLDPPGVARLAEAGPQAARSAVAADGLWGLPPFMISQGPVPAAASGFTLQAPTSAENVFRVLRAMQLPKPILLEGSPGVGKTSLVAAIARECGHPIVRLNLSEQTDVTDLFGSDLPVEGSSGEFAWRDGPLLQALKEGAWVLLDELNLASQSVLEGLNACLDHRGTVFVPELNKTFACKPAQFRLFACQNPLSQGGGRKGLPKSFLNRFTQVHVESLEQADLASIVHATYPALDRPLVERMIRFTVTLQHQVCVLHQWGRGCTDFNLRDVFRWCDLMATHQPPGRWQPQAFVDLVFARRMRSPADRQRVYELFASCFDGLTVPCPEDRQVIRITPHHVQLGQAVMARREHVAGVAQQLDLRLSPSLCPPLEAMMQALNMGWMINLVGPRAAGKTSLVRLLAALTGQPLREFAMNSAVDTMEILGGFEQVDLQFARARLRQQLTRVLHQAAADLLTRPPDRAVWATLKELQYGPATLDEQTMADLIQVAVRACAEHQLPYAHAVQELQARLADLQAGYDTRGAFRWTDGMLIEAMQRGEWLLIDNVNFCSPSVLDRLNGLLEPGGNLILGERGVIDGSVPTIQPHPNFRLIFAMDPLNGDISRAMKNRGVEIFVSAMSDTTMAGLLDAVGLPGRGAAHTLHTLHAAVVRAVPWLARPGHERLLLHAAQLYLTLLQRGLPHATALAWTVGQTYDRRCALPADREAVAEQLALALQQPVPTTATAELVPASFPVALTARLWCRDSVLATILWHGSVAEWLARSMGQTSDHNPVAVWRHVLRTVVLEAAPPAQSLTLLPKWLQGVIAPLIRENAEWLAEFELFSGLAKVLPTHPIIQHLQQLVAATAPRLLPPHASSVSEWQPLDLRSNWPLWTGPTADNDLMAHAGDAAYTLSKLLADRLMEQQQLQAWQASSSTVALRACWLGQALLHRQHRLDASRLAHDAVAVLLPLVEAVDALLDAALLGQVQPLPSDAALAAIQHRRRELWAVAASSGDDTAGSESVQLQFHTRWLMLCETLGQHAWPDALAQHFGTLAARVNAVFPPGGLGGVLQRFEPFCVFPFKQQLVWELHRELAAQAQELDVASLLAQQRGDELGDTHLAVRATRGLKSTLLEALATAHVLDSLIVQATDVLAVDAVSAAALPPAAAQLYGVLASCRGHLDQQQAQLPAGQLQLKRQLWPLYAALVLDLEVAAVHNLLNVHLALQTAGQALPAAWAAARAAVANLLMVGLADDAACGVVDLAPYQQWLWAHDEQQRMDLVTSAVLGRVLPACLQRQWASTLHHHDSAALRGAPCMVHVATYTHVLMPLVEMAHVPMRGLRDKLDKCLVAQQTLDRYADPAQHLAAAQTRQLAVVARQQALALVASLGSPVMLDASNADHVDVDEVFGAVEPHDVQAVLRTAFDPAVLHEPLAAGRAYVQLGLCQLSLCRRMPAVDPVVRDAAEFAGLQARLRDLRAEMHARTLSARVLHEPSDQAGSSATPRLVQLEQQAQELTAQGREVLRRLVLRPCPSQYGKLMREVQRFAYLCAPQRVEQLVQRCQSTEVLAMQQAITGFCAALARDTYAQYPDVVQPLQTAARNLQLGLQLCLLGQPQPAVTEPSQVLGLVVRPARPARDAAAVARQLSDPHVLHAVAQHWGDSVGPGARTQLLTLALAELATAQQIGGPLPANARAVADQVLALFVQEHEEQEEARRQAEAAKAATFRYKDRTVLDDVDADAELQRDFAKFFPSYAKDFADLARTEQDDEAAPMDDTDSAAADGDDGRLALETDRLRQLARLHARLYGPAVIPALSADELVVQRQDQRSSHFKLACQLLETLEQAARSDLDHAAWDQLQAQLAQLQQLRSASQAAEAAAAATAGQDEAELEARRYGRKGAAREPDVHRQAHVAETQRAVPVLQALMARVAELLQEFPENEVLAQMWVIMERILGFSVSAPVMQILTGLDLLLSRAQDWQLRASKAVSLLDHLQAISHLMLDWRSLELEQWPLLLEHVLERFENKSARAWPALYALVTGVPATGDATATSAHLRQTFEHLNMFMANSSLGEFAFRLGMVQSFAHHVAQLALDEASTPAQAYRRVLANLLANLAAYFGIFRATIADQASAVRKPLQKEIADHVKMVRWKDTNYDAMKAAATKTRTALHRLTRKFEEGLLRPAAEYIAQPKAPAHVSQAGAGLPALSTLLVRQTVHGEVRPGDRAVLVLTQAGGDVRAAWARGLDDLTMAVLDRVQAFREWDEQHREDKAKLKHGKLMKQRALAQLLRELGRLGLNYRRVKAEDVSIFDGLQLPANQFANLPQALVPAQAGWLDTAVAWLQEHWAGCTETFFHNMAKTNQLRVLVREPARDVGANDVTRMAGFAEDLLAVQFRQRTLAADFFEPYQDLLALASRVLAPPAEQMAGLMPAEPVRAQLQAVMAVVAKALVVVADVVAYLGSSSAAQTALDVLLALRAQALEALQQAQKASVASTTKAGELVQTVQQVLAEHVLPLSRDTTVRQRCPNLAADLAQLALEEAPRLLHDSAAGVGYAPSEDEDAGAQELTALLLKRLKAVSKCTQEFHASAAAMRLQDRPTEAKPEEDGPEGADEEQEAAGWLAPGHLVRLHQELVAALRALGLPSVLEALQQHMGPAVLATRALLGQYVSVCNVVVMEFTLAHEHVSKMHFVLTGLFADLVRRGFCMPSEQEQGDQEQDHDGMELDGTGIGEGQGSKDVSDQIEDEEQVLGTQNEQPEAQQQQEDQEMPEEDQGLEMSNDFEGELYDKDKPEGDDDQEGEEDELDPDELDQQMGKTDNEKADLTEERPLDRDQPEDHDLDQAEGQDGGQGNKERELVGADSTENEDQDDRRPEPPKASEQEAGEQEQESNNEAGEEEPAPQQDDHETDATRPEDATQQPPGGEEQRPPDGDLDLPDDLDLEGGEDEQEGDEMETGDGDEQGDGDDAEGSPDQEPQQEFPDADDMQVDELEQPPDELQPDGPPADDNEQGPDAPPDAPEHDDEEPGEDMDVDEMPVPEHTAGEDAMDQEDEADEAPGAPPTGDSAEAPPPPPEANGEEHQAAREQATQASATVQSQQPQTANTTLQGEQADQSAGQDTRAQETSGAHTSEQRDQPSLGPQAPHEASAEQATQPQAYERNSQTNPYRDLGDASKAWRDRLQVQDMDTQGEVPDQPLNDRAEAYAYLQAQPLQEEEELQATGAATEEQQQAGRLGDETAEDDQLAGMEGDEVRPMDIRPEEPEDGEAMDYTEAKVEAQGLQEDDDSERDHDNQTDQQADAKQRNAGQEAGAAAREDDRNQPLLQVRTMTSADNLEELRQRTEAELDQLLHTDEPDAAAAADVALDAPAEAPEALWHMYEALTSQLSQDLCEQLRLVLEASQAAKMRGDYRTGKRLNMRKIIPYIASEFRKDKIWLRRTRPSKREYQVMLAIDDSQSMALYHSKQLALEALCMISNALTRLEVGELAVMSFGTQTELVHPFDTPFSTTAGAELLQHFSFQQQRTMVGALLSHAARVFAERKAHKRDTGLVTDQLLFVVSDSDNLYQEGEATVERWVRTCNDLGILVVFVVIDRLVALKRIIIK